MPRSALVTVTISSILGASLIKYWPNDSEIIESYSGLGLFWLNDIPCHIFSKMGPTWGTGQVAWNILTEVEH